MSQLPPELIHLVLGYYHIPHVKLITTFENYFPNVQLHISHVNQNIYIRIYHCIMCHNNKYIIDSYWYGELLKCINAFQNNQCSTLKYMNPYGTDITIHTSILRIQFVNSQCIEFPNTQPIRQQFLHAFQELADTIPKVIDNLNVRH